MSTVKSNSDQRLRSLLLDLTYSSALLASSPYLLYKIKTSERYRTGLGQRLGDVPVRHGDRPCLWIHAASVGEVHAGLPLIRQCQEEKPEIEVVVSTQTSTGQEVAKQHCPDCLRFYFPIDLTPVIAKVFERIRPSCVALVEREIWPNFVAEAKRRAVPVIQVNSRITDSSVKAYRWLYPVIGSALQRIDSYSVQTEVYAERLRSLAVPEERIQVTGNLKYDGFETSVPVEEQQRLRREMGLSQNAPVLVGGSIHPSEESALLHALRLVRKKRPDVRLVLAPRHAERIPKIEQAIAEAGEISARKTSIQKASSPAEAHRGNIVIVDTMGELRSIYSLAEVVFVGGTLVPIGGHSLMEPAALGRPVVFGPQIFKQPADAETLLGAEAAFRCFEEDEVAKQILRLFNDTSLAETMGKRARAAIQEHAGAAKRTFQILKPYFQEN